MRPFEQAGMQQCHYDVPPMQLYPLMLQMLAQSKAFILQSSGNPPMTCIFSTHVSLYTWGENMMAAVTPDGDGSMVAVSVNAKFATLFQGSRNRKNIARFFDQLSQELASAQGQAQVQP
ncbi:hypothetical protein PT282_06985 [Bifidobacterium sp. ESL0763]|uniref:hypothetical protein n=1 Tax=Bifidobacterium sp. ESL0763 TaxID=2983227 RepID=UPI0023F999FB|nr:hypothetical protein [Bifidobacterium sp. ESL0763]MDF7664400.1 hypothetical protein [Bifidobacterium sp. ESL0763]